MFRFVNKKKNSLYMILESIMWYLHVLYTYTIYRFK